MSMNLSFENVIEKSDIVDRIITEKDRQNVKYHRKMENHSKFNLPLSTWNSCIRQKVDKLPYDINGLQVFILSYDKKNPMKSSVDGRSKWKTANFDGGHSCGNVRLL